MKKLNWVSNEKETGTFIQIRNTDDKSYFITKGKNEHKYTLTIIDDNIKKYFDTIEESKKYAEVYHNNGGGA